MLKGQSSEMEEEIVDSMINEESLKLATSKINKESNKYTKKQYYYNIIIALVIIIALITIIYINIPNIQLYLKEKEILYTLNNEFPDISKENKKLFWKNEKLNLRKVKKEVHEYSKHFEISYENKEDFYKRNDPKISLIIPVYNKEKFLKPLYASIQNQSLKDIEIIFIDDLSHDKSIEIIESFMEKDKRIVLIKHSINRRTFYSRNEASKISKGKYLMFIDPDDLIINNILEKSYEVAEKNDLDITQFHMIWGTFRKMELTEFKYKNGIIYYPHLKDIIYFGETRNVCDKLIKKDIVLKSLDFMNPEFRTERYEVHDDDAAFYGLINVAKSYGFLEQIGYFYFLGVPDSTTKTKFNSNKINKIFSSIFTIMKYYFVQSENNRKEKLLVAYQFFFKKVYLYFNYIQYLTEGIDFVKNVLDLYLKCTFYTEKEKYFLDIFKNKVIQEENRKKNKN